MRKIFVLLAVATSLSACSTDAFKPGPDVTLTDNYKNRAGLKGETVQPETTWWANFGDQNLNRLIEEALANNLSIELARERVAQAQISARLTRASFMPQIEAAASAALAGARTKANVPVGKTPSGQPITQYKYVTSEQNTRSVALNGQWNINPFQWRSASEVDKANVIAQREGVNAARLDIIAAVATAYLNAQGFGRQLEIAKRSLSVQNETSSITSAKVDAGSASTLDLTRARANAALTSADIPSLQQAREQSINQIAVLLGKTPAEFDNLFTKYKAIKRPRVRFSEGIPADLLRNRPDIRQQEQLLIGAVAAIGVAEADLYPSLTLSGTIRASKTAGVPLQAWSFGPSINIPIFDRGALYASVDLSKSTARQQYLAYRQTVINAVTQVENAMVALRQEQMRYSRLSVAVDELTKAEALARELNEAGTTEFSDVLTAQSALYGAQLQLADSSLQLAQNYVLLCQALGGGWAGEDVSN